MGFESKILIDCGVLFIALVIILGSSELFTNGVEWLGKRLQLSEGVVGSVLAAVGTALPETLIPIVAVLSFGTKQAHGVGIGAIAGAPFMLSTLTLGLCGFAMWFFAKKGNRSTALKFNKVVICRDLRFFIIAYSLALISATFSSMPQFRTVIAFILIGIYMFYLHKTFSHEGEVGEPPEVLHFDRVIKAGTGLIPILCQVLVGILGILGGAYLFVDHVQSLAVAIDVPEVILALLIAPVATEMPEKINSILWARNGKDTLALGNVTGALVFQSCFPVAFGVAFTSWNLGWGTIVTGMVAVLSAFCYMQLIEKDKLQSHYLMAGAMVYITTITWLIFAHLTD
jgi:cation:H+ antiporter